MISSLDSRTPWYKQLYVQTLIGVALGLTFGLVFPEKATLMRPLGEAFINLIKMMIGPIIFCTVVHGIASVGDIGKLGRLGWKVFVYFEVVSTLALFIGLIVVNVGRPGDGFTPAGQAYVASEAAAAKVAEAKETSKNLDPVQFLMHVIPKTIVEPFVSGDLLSLLFVSILASVAILSLGERKGTVLHAIDVLSQILFRMLGMLVKLAPIGAFGAMAYTAGEFGGGGLLRLANFMFLFYLTAILFIAFVLGTIAWWSGFSLWKFLVFIKEELLLVLGTSSSETALPGLMTKLEKLGCARSTVGLVVPTGYSFNLDGTNIYMAMAAMFVAQATNTELSLREQIGLLIVAMITSKGASGVTGAGFVTLIATLQVYPKIPTEAAFILIGIDRFMSECRALTNFIGNGVAAMVISRWEKEEPSEICIQQVH